MKAGFFRHGPAVPRGTPGVAEDDRPLTPEGREKTARAAKGLRSLDLGFERIFTSPLARALQTAEILAEVLELPRPELLELLIPGTPPRRLLAELGKLKADAPLLVGHEPLLSGAVLQAIGSAVAGSIELKKAGLAVVEFRTKGPRPEGTLKLLLAPGVLRDLA